MDILPLKISGAFRIVLDVHRDHRGFFVRTYDHDELAKQGLVTQWLQESHSFSAKKGTVRGLHFQLPPMAQAKLVSVLRGRILDVIVDARRGSPTFGTYVSGELSAESGWRVYIPIGFAHGFLTLEDDVLVMYKTSDYYAPAHDSGVHWNDPDIAFPWPLNEADISAIAFPQRVCESVSV